MIYKPAPGSKLTQRQVQRYGERIASIIERNNGTVTKIDLMDDARHSDSPLHDHFEWDDATAAESWRLEQARYLLRSIHVVIKRDDDTEEQVRFLYNVNQEPETDDQEPQRVYVSIKRVLSEMEIRQQVIEQALCQLESWRNRYHQYTEFSSVFAALADVKQEQGI